MNTERGMMCSPGCPWQCVPRSESLTPTISHPQRGAPCSVGERALARAETHRPLVNTSEKSDLCTFQMTAIAKTWGIIN